MELFLASNNEHKLEELADLFMREGCLLNLHSARVLGGMPEVDENAPDFEGNARLKAEALLEHVGSKGWVLADDSGLEVDALGGLPGVHTARYAGLGATDEANNHKLLQALAGLDGAERKARFRCVLVLMHEEGAFHAFSGSCEGTIATETKGLAGFGYDPLFIPEGYDRTFAELGPAIKQQLSHRAKAFTSLLDWLKKHEG